MDIGYCVQYFCVLSGILIFWGYIKIIFSRKCGRTSSVGNTLASGARGPRSDPLLQRGKFRYPNTLSRSFSSVICRNDTRLVHLPSDRDDNWTSPVHGKVSLVQVKEPYGNLDMVTPVHEGSDRKM